MTFKNNMVPITLYKMLFKIFINWYLLAQLLGIMVFVIFDLFTNIDTYLDKEVPIIYIISMTLLFIPKAIWFTMPFVIMFGIIMSISSLYQSNELIAIFTSGISYKRFTFPIIFTCIVLSVAMIFIDSYGVVYAMRQKDKLYKRFTSDKPDEYNNITLKSEKKNTFWHIDDFDPVKNKLQNIIVFTITDEYKMIERIYAAKASYTKNGWLFYSGVIRSWDKDGLLISETKFSKKLMTLPEKPNIFKTSDYEIENMSINEAFERIKLLEKLNVERKKELTDFYKKFSFPMILIVFAIFAIGVSTLSKIYILITALFLSISQAILYYIMQFLIFDNLSYTGIISPFIGAWLSFVFFLPLALWLLYRAKT